MSAPKLAERPASFPKPNRSVVRVKSWKLPQMSSLRFARSARRSVVAFFVLCAAIILMAVLAAGAFLLNPFSGLDGGKEFAGLSGSLAKQSLDTVWPSSVDPATVESVSYKTQWSRDSFSSWFRIKLTKDAAKLWADHLHAEQERYARWAMGDSHESIECLHRIINGPPPLHHQTGETPAWWSAPSTTFRATEIMLWYKGMDSGVSRAVYSAFDESTGILWIYEYAAQHDKLWSPGKMPAAAPIVGNPKEARAARACLSVLTDLIR